MDIPKHILVIPDGGRRWAKINGLPSYEGHSRGAERFVEGTNAVFERGIPWFTFWAASENNLTNRSSAEVAFLIALMRKQLRQGIKPFKEKSLKLRMFGRGTDIIGNDSLTREVQSFKNLSVEGAKYNLTILFGYDGEREVDEAEKALAKANSEHIHYPYCLGNLKKFCWTANLPEVDLVIRTGELQPNWAHLSAGCMMLHTINSELYFPPIHWPDFSALELDKALKGYSQRRRCLGS